jgi:hypothetical protein
VTQSCTDAGTDLTEEEALAILEPYFKVVRERFLEHGLDRVKRVRLGVDGKIHDTARHFAACYEDGSEIVVAPEMAELGYDTVCAMFAHELGHAVDFNYPAEFLLRGSRVQRIAAGDADSELKAWRQRLNGWKRRDQDTIELTADGIAEEVMGTPIGYRGPCLLQTFGGPRRPLGLR